MENIRKYLANLINDENGKNWYIPELFKEKTLAKLPSEIFVVENPSEEKENYNCFIYALSLSKDKTVTRDTHGFIYSEFIQKLIDEGELELTEKPEIGDIILYKNPAFSNEITHAGVLEEKETVISKWSWGPIIRHKIFDVPDFYGNDIFYVKKVNDEKARGLYQKYKKFNINNATN